MPVFVGSGLTNITFTSTSSSSATMTWVSGTASTLGMNSPTTSVWTTMVPFSTAQEALAMQQQAVLQQQLLNQQQSRFMQGLGMSSPTMTPAERERIERERAAAIEEARVRALQRQEAHTRAKALLLSFLSAEQRQQFESGESFIVVGKSGTRYRIRRGHIGNVDVLRKSDDYVVQRLCFHPSNDNELPVYDTMLAQMLHLRDDDVGARRIANVHH